MLDPDRRFPAPVPRPTSPPRFRSAVTYLVPFALLFAPSPAAAQTPQTPADKIAALRLDWQTQLARLDAATWEADIVSAPHGSGQGVNNFEDPSEILKQLRRVLGDKYDAARNSLRALAEKAKDRRGAAEKEWGEVVRHRVAFREHAEKCQSIYGFDFDSGTHPLFQLDAVDAGLLLWAAVVALFALHLRRRELRLDIRKAKRAAAAALLLGTLTVSGCGSRAGDARPWAAREEAELTVALADATARADAASAAADRKWQATADAWAGLVASAKSGVEDVASIVREGEKNLRESLRGVVTDARLADRLARDAEEQQAKLADEKAKLDDLLGGAKWRRYAGMVLRVAAAAVLFGLSIAPFWTARRLRAKRIRQASRTCPRCFRHNTLKVEKAGGDAPVSRYKGGKKKSDEETPEEEDAGGDDVRCTKCGMRIRKSYLTVPRLCFPTVGVRSSGKTHMLVTAFDRIRKRTAPTTATVQPAPSGGDVDRRFDQLADEILHRRGVAGATDLVLPDPILVHVKDSDAEGPTSALVNLFDYSGELINPDVDVNMLKATAVRMDGFMLFLDPTQLYGDGANVTLDQQLGMLDEFLAHMRKERKIPVGEVIPVPVAVCIPKFDLLLSDNPIGGQSVQFIRELMENLSPPPRQMTLETLRERSELVEQMLPMMFPGADIRGIIEGYFGKQLLFFPMSSVSLFEHELGVRELDRRTIAPFGVAEPMVWLLHMHGYCVFGV